MDDCALSSIVSYVEFELLHQKDSHQRPAQYNAQHTTHTQHTTHSTQHTTHNTQHTTHNTQHSRYGTYVKIFKSYFLKTIQDVSKHIGAVADGSFG